MRPIISGPSPVAQSLSSSRIAQSPPGSASAPAAAAAAEVPPRQDGGTDQSLQNNGTANGGAKKPKKELSSSLSMAPGEAPLAKPVSTKPPPVGGKLSWKHFLGGGSGNKQAAAVAAAAPVDASGTADKRPKKAKVDTAVVDENNNEMALPLGAKSPLATVATCCTNDDAGTILANPGNGTTADDDGRKLVPNGCDQNGGTHHQPQTKENGTEKHPQPHSNGGDVKSDGNGAPAPRKMANGPAPLPPTTNGVARKENVKSEIKVKIAPKDEKKEPTVITTMMGKLSSKTLELKRSTSGHRLTAATSAASTIVEENGGGSDDIKEKKKSAYLLTDSANDGTAKGLAKVGKASAGKVTSPEKTGPIGVRLSLKPSRSSVTPDRTADKSATVRTARASPVRSTATDDGMPKEKSPSERRVLGEVKRDKTPLRSASSKSLSATVDTAGKMEVKEAGDGDATALTSATTSAAVSASRPVVKVRKVIKKIIKKKPKPTEEGEPKDRGTELVNDKEGLASDRGRAPAMVGTLETTITHEMADTAVVKGMVEISKLPAGDEIVEKVKKKATSKDTQKVQNDKDEDSAAAKLRTIATTPSEPAASPGPQTVDASKERQLSERKHWAIRKRAMTDRAMSCGPLEDDRSGAMLEQFLLSLATLPQEIAVDLPVGAATPLPRFGSNRSLARSASQYLSSKIHDFLRRTDHVMQDWRNLGRTLGRRDDHGVRGTIGDVTGLTGTARSRSVSNIIARGLQLLREQSSPRSLSGRSSVSRSSSRSSFYCDLVAPSATEQKAKQALLLRRRRRSRIGNMGSLNDDGDGDDDDDDCSTVVDMSEELSDISSELTEEHSSSNLITERLATETSERLRLEKEVKDYESKYRNLQESSEKMEMELLCAKSELNCDFDDCSTIGEYDGDGTERDGLQLGGADGEVAKSYRLRYERVARELEFTKKRLQTQHEHDLEQLVGLKKQLEKKLSDAYEEVEEQRQVVAQWKRKAQKMTNEMNDLRMLYEEQNSRNNLLEKRQRKFDAECQTLQDSARQEKQAKERIAREKDVLMAEKCKLEQTVSDIRLELELKEEKNTALQQELDEMAFGGGTEEEIAQLKRQKMELDRRCKEQDEELDEMAGQIQLLEQAKLRLEMSLETSRKESRKEAQQRDDEMEEIRGASYKKIKSLECQLEQEHEERTQLLRDKHELERKLASLEDQDRAERAAEEAMVQRLKRDARKYRALLRDAQSQLDRAKGDSASKALVRQLRNQLEDAESARVGALKARQVLEGELQDAQMLFEETQRARNEAEDKATMAQRDRAELQAQIDENEEELAELMKKYSATVKQLSSEQTLIAEFELRVSELEGEKKSLKEQVVELATRLESVETIGEPSNSMAFKRLELRTKELESRLEFEQATRARIEIQLNRHKDSLEKLQGELMQARNRESQAQDALKKAQKTVRELRDEMSTLANRDQEGLLKRKELEKRIETAESETASARADLRLALQRIADLQQAMEEEGDSYQSDSDTSDSSSSMDSFHESTVTRKSPSVGSGDHFGTTNGGSSRGSIGSLASSTRDGRKESNNPSLFGSVRRKKRLHPTIKEEDESFVMDDQAGPGVGSSSKSQTPDLISSLANNATKHNGVSSAANDGQDTMTTTEHVETVAAACQRLNESKLQPNPQHNSSSSSPVKLQSPPPPVPQPTSGGQCEFPFDIDTLKSIKEKIHSLNQIIRDESHDSGTEIDLVDLKNLKNQIHEFKKAIECSRSRSMDKLSAGGGSTLSAGIITTSASTGSASSGKLSARFLYARRQLQQQRPPSSVASSPAPSYTSMLTEYRRALSIDHRFISKLPATPSKVDGIGKPTNANAKPIGVKMEPPTVIHGSSSNSNSSRQQRQRSITLTMAAGSESNQSVTSGAAPPAAASATRLSNGNNEGALDDSSFA
uniref:Myosin tail domain-containing protein n=1 Tax=Anopheles dirus TaxID=7168 RepID=A0A182N297_9DIPT